MIGTSGRTQCLRAMLIAIVWATSLLSTTAVAKDDLKVRVSLPHNGRIRSHAGLPIEIEIEWANERLLEGYLEITFREQSNTNRQTFYTYRSHDLALSFGKRHLSALLPPTPVRDSQGLVSYSTQFVGENETINLGQPTDTLITPGLYKPRLLVGVVLPDPAVPEERTHFTEVLKFEAALNIPTLNSLNLRRRMPTHSLKDVMTQSQRIDVTELPASAQRLCAYDVLIVADGSLQVLKEKQLDALATWIEAGGSAMFELIGNGYSRRHVDFLNRLTNFQRTAETPLLLADAGRIEMSFEDSPDPARKNVGGFRPGLGRVVVTNQPLNTIFNRSEEAKSECSTFGGFLWNERQKGVLGGDVRSDSILTHDVLTKALTPARVQSVPPSSVITMLVVFLLAISIGDYFFLGLIGKRNWTWVLFPLLSLGFTVYTVQMARHHVGSSDFTSAITLIDTSADGRVLRSNRIETLFTAVERTSHAKLRHAMYAPLNAELFPPNPEELGSYSANRMGMSSVSYPQNNRSKVVHQPPVCIGSVPAVYEVERQMRKWTPQTSRYMTLGSKSTETFPEFDWGIADWGLWRNTPVEGWANSVFEQHPDAQILVCSPGKDPPPVVSAELSEAETERWSAVWMIVKQLTVSKVHHVNSVSARRAPTGGCYLNDIGTVDSSNTSGDFAAVVIIPRGEEFYVFRHTHFGQY